jgi:hypothetical protein
VTQKVNSKENQKNLKSIHKKCNNIRSLYLNESFKTIELIVKSWKSLKSFFFDEVLLRSESRMKRIGPLFSKSRIFNLSVNHWNENRINEKNAAFVRNMPLLWRINLIEPKSIRNTLECIQSKNIVKLKAMTTGDSEMDENQQQEDIDSVVSLISRNERFVSFPSIDDYFVTDETINNINPTKLYLIYLSINCRNLSFGSVINLI